MPRGSGSVSLIAVEHARRCTRLMPPRTAGGLKQLRTRLHMRRFPQPEKLGRGLGPRRQTARRREEKGSRGET